MCRSTSISMARSVPANSVSEARFPDNKKGRLERAALLHCAARLFGGVVLLVEPHRGENFRPDVFGALLLDMLGDAAADSHHSFAHEGRAVVARPVERCLAVVGEVLEL